VVSSEGTWISDEEDDKLHAGSHREARCKMYANNMPQSPEKVQKRRQFNCVRHDTHTQLQSYWT
jgi:hypothetical protein